MMRLFKRIGIGLVLLFFLSSLTKTLFEYWGNLAFYEDYRTTYEQEKKKNTELKTEALRQTDLFTIEQKARDKLNLQKPGEQVVILPSPTPTPTVMTPTPMPIYRQWAETLF